MTPETETQANVIPNTQDLKAVRSMLLDMFRQGRPDEAVELVIELLTHVRAQNTELRLQLLKFMRAKHGKKGEGVSSQQLDLFLSLLAEQSNEDVPGFEPGEESSKDDSASTEKKNNGAPHGRRPFPEHLPRRIEQSAVPEERRTCDCCGQDGQTVRWEKSYMLNFVEGYFEVVVCEQELVACPDSSCDSGIVSAPAIQRIIPGGMADCGLLVHLLLGKYQDHLPLYRMNQRFKRNFGVDLASTTMSDWMIRLGSILAVLASLIRSMALTSYVLQADATYIKMQDSTHPSGIKQCFLWCCIGDGRYASL